MVRCRLVEGVSKFAGTGLGRSGPFCRLQMIDLEWFFRRHADFAAGTTFGDGQPARHT
jgi:hypothetical protein